MKYIVTLLSFFILSFVEAGSSIRVFTNSQIAKCKLELSDKSLNSAFNNETLSDFPLDRVQPLYDRNILQIKIILESAVEDESGYKLSDPKDKDLLVFLVEVTRRYSKSYDPGNAHFGSFSDLYSVAPKDLSLAIERSSLTGYDKKIVRANIKSKAQ